jgi:phosphonate transport system ATP-binding protein
MLELRKVTKTFGETIAVNNVSLSFAPGQMVGIIGRSGAGKSTLLRLINRLASVGEGRITFGDIDVGALEGKALRAWRARCAVQPREPAQRAHQCHDRPHRHGGNLADHVQALS